MSAPTEKHNRPASNPGGCECRGCGVIFIGEEHHCWCALCVDKPNPALIEKHRREACNLFGAYLRRIGYDRRACYENDELLQEMIERALAQAEQEGRTFGRQEGMKRAAAVAYSFINPEQARRYAEGA